MTKHAVCIITGYIIHKVDFWASYKRKPPNKKVAKGIIRSKIHVTNKTCLYHENLVVDDTDILKFGIRTLSSHSLKRVNNKCADQASQMHRLICAVVVSQHKIQSFFACIKRPRKRSNQQLLKDKETFGTFNFFSN